jgi:coatomer protein complex subunit gamma
MQGMYVAAKFACVLKFTSKEVDPSSGEPEQDGYEDEYTLEDIDVSVLDFVHTTVMPNFRKVRPFLRAKLGFDFADVH